MGESSLEKRNFQRVPFQTSVTVQCGEKVFRSRDELTISMNGLGFTTGDPLPATGSPCSVLIEIDGTGEPVVIEAEGTVVRSEQGTIAVEFTGVELDSYQHLRRLVTSNAADPERADAECESHWGIRKRQPPAG